MFAGDIQEDATTRLLKDASSVWKRLVFILGKSCYIRKGDELIKWDFFLPFIISLVFPLVVYFPEPTSDVASKSMAFALFFSFLWIMGFAIAFNASIVGICLDYLPVVSIVLCEILPICVAGIAAKFLSFLPKVILISLAVIYSLIISKRTLQSHVASGKWIMVYQPIIFMYITSGVLIIFNN